MPRGKEVRVGVNFFPGTDHENCVLALFLLRPPKPVIEWTVRRCMTVGEVAGRPG